MSLANAFFPVTIPPAAERLRVEVKSFLSEWKKGVAPHRRARSWSEFDGDFSRALAQRGWLGLTVPAQYGGAGADAFSRFVLVEELLSAGAPVAAHWIGDRQSAPLLLRYGTEAQRCDLLPRICRGEIFFCIGMSEPDAGSDLASVRTRAERSKHGWQLNGQKIWTTYAHKSNFMIALVRTSGSPSDRQTGLSQFLIDLSLPGVEIRPIADLCGDTHFSEVFFDNVHLPNEALVGIEGDGWAQVNAELAFERSGPERIYSSVVLLDLWTDEMIRLGATETQRTRLGSLIARMAVLREMSLSVTARLCAGESPMLEAALIKDLGTLLEQDIPAMIADGTQGGMDLAGLELIRTLAYSLQISPAYSLRGGTREILRGMIARGMGLR